MDSACIALLQKISVVLFVIALSWKIIRYMCSLLNVEREPVRVLITGAAGKFNFSFASFFPSKMFCVISFEKKWKEGEGEGDVCII